MNATTRNTVKAVVGGDPTVTPEMLEIALAALDGQTVATSPRKVKRLMRPKEVANALGVSTKTVRSYAKRGLLHGIKTGSGGARTTAYAEDDVAEFAEHLRA